MSIGSHNGKIKGQKMFEQYISSQQVRRFTPGQMLLSFGLFIEKFVGTSIAVVFSLTRFRSKLQIVQLHQSNTVVWNLLNSHVSVSKKTFTGLTLPGGHWWYLMFSKSNLWLIRFYYQIVMFMALWLWCLWGYWYISACFFTGNNLGIS